jgi:hypothetical protein
MAKKRADGLFYGGFVNGRIDDNVWCGKPKMPAIFTNKRHARESYQDVRPVELVPVRKTRRK